MILALTVSEPDANQVTELSKYIFTVTNKMIYSQHTLALAKQAS